MIANELCIDRNEVSTAVLFAEVGQLVAVGYWCNRHVDEEYTLRRGQDRTCAMRCLDNIVFSMFLR